jgi:hypothetical protein
MLPARTSSVAPTRAPESPAKEVTTPAAPNAPIPLENPGFEGITETTIPGWWRSAYDNYSSGDTFDSDTSFEQPFFKQADDPARAITGPTLQIDTAGFPKFRAFVYQTANVPPGATVRFSVSARAYSSEGDILVKAGVDPDGTLGCEWALWGGQIAINESAGIVRLVSPDVTAGQAGRVTICVFAETVYASPHQAAFFDDAELVTNPE